MSTWTKVVSMDSYDIQIGYGLVRSLAQFVRQLIPTAQKYILITDERLFDLYGQRIIDNFNENQLELVSYRIPSGEQSKCRQVKANIEDFMFDHECHLDSVILALGGGVVGDLAGFVASTYMRGIDYIQIPTSFLSMVDSSIGAKTGINVRNYGKNLLGTFYRPKSVLIDIEFLETLSSRDFANGMAEVIKMALILDEQLFSLIENHLNEIFNRNEKILIEIICRSVELKGDVVRKDEKETSGYRSILNFGHSIGHAIEILSHGQLLHGECVSIGIILESELARDKGFLRNSNVVLSRIQNLLKSFHLPTTIPTAMSFTDIIHKMSIDKKNKHGKKQIVILTNIGSVKSTPRYTTMIDDQDLIHLLDQQVCLQINSIPRETRFVNVPGSKSLSNRVLLLSALGQGSCLLKGLLYSIDTQTMLICLKQLSIQYEFVQNENLIIHGVNGFINTDKQLITFYLNNSGTSSRFLTTLCTILPENTRVILTGDQRLKQRPIEDLADALTQNSIQIQYLEKQGCLPIEIRSNGHFQGGSMNINANISSQYITSLLLMAPFAKIPLELQLNQSKSIVSQPYIDMTVQLMKSTFNISIDDSQSFVYRIPNRKTYLNPSEIQIEGDASSASYFLGMAAVHPGLTVTILNIGQTSLQGDSQFFRLLQLMGCQVQQTDTTTTLTGPQQLNAIQYEIDMNSMTDTFMTLAAVASFACGTTRIINIENQRLKECNRIEAMVNELNKCGIDAQETSTGLTIQGNNNQNLTQSASIHCYDDHRIAMSFAIIASRAPFITIEDKHCVDKTYPQFWLDLKKTFDFDVISPTLRLTNNELTRKRKILFFIGMPCSGKSTLAKFISKKLNHLTMFDLDEEITKEITEGHSIKQYVQLHGWTQFRQLELQIFKQIHQQALQFDTDVLISCGGGVVETEEIRKILSQEKFVIYIHRHLDDILEDYAKEHEDNVRPLMDLNDKFQMRIDFYRSCSNFEFVILKNDRDWISIENNLVQFVKRILTNETQSTTTTTTISDDSFFICLTFPNLLNVCQDKFLSIIKGCEAIELRVDLLQSIQFDFLGQQIAFIRKYSHLPIIFTVRTIQSFGRFPHDEQQIFQLLDFAIKLQCEFIDLEMNLNQEKIRHWLNQITTTTTSSIIASLHLKLSQFEIEKTIQQFHFPQIRIAKVAIDIDNHVSIQDEVLPLFFQFKSQFQQEMNQSKLILIGMGQQAKLTRILNRYLTPVTHPLLHTPAASGQLTVQQIQQARLDLGLIQHKDFYLLGQPIQQSLSPRIHQTAFDYFSLPFQYHLFESNDVSLVQNLCQQSSFAGASVTIPLKEQLFHLFNADKNNLVSSSAQQIGAINTIHKRQDGSFFLDNTDWKAIYQLINDNISSNTSVLLIGAGATARASLYALLQIDFIQNIFIFNPRTPTKADELVQLFANDHHRIQSISTDQIQQLTNIQLIINTLPSAIHFTLDPKFFENNSSSNSFLFDVNYLPRQTQLMKQAQSYQWNFIYAIDMLIQQALQQFQLWTQKHPTTIQQTLHSNLISHFNQ